MSYGSYWVRDKLDRFACLIAEMIEIDVVGFLLTTTISTTMTF